MSTKAQWISLWSTVFFVGVMAVAFLAFPGFFPPMSPQLSADQVAAFYAENTAMIRFSMITFNLCAVMLIPFFMVIVIQMKRMATPSHVLAYSYIGAVSTGATMFAIADIIWLVAAFRPNRDPQLIQLLNDLAWLIFIAPVGMFVVQNLCLALAIYLDAGSRPVFPRWVAVFSIVTAAAMTPAIFAVVFQSGPFAWDGAVSFWLRIGAFCLNITVMFFVLCAVVKRQAVEQADRRRVTESVAPEPVTR
ncbi:hypothetical protein M1247_22880 [Mycobacterium sp. 21AC1]|uniref:hypothetical protein n=1 Tax=[Mycobacterium] appelbergii TaxID=2939269 RepID=UPI0029390A6B|nr:hypothetical protein [Mycobacterium sp. 21AC1]MDV3127780.1 hypothetical protein [Mycobacterium sp. 21AC1]